MIEELEKIQRNGIKLSDAILKGADMRFSCDGKLFTIEYCSLCSCTLGAALEGTYGQNILKISNLKFLTSLGNHVKINKILINIFPELNNFIVNKDILSKYDCFDRETRLNLEVTLMDFIMTLNDYSDYSREQIAYLVAEMGF